MDGSPYRLYSRRGCCKMQQPREERRMKREKKRYFLTKMIKKSPEGTPILFTFHFSLFTQGVLQIFATPPFCLLVFHQPAAAVALDDGMGNDDLGGGQVGIFHMVDDLVCRLLTQEEGVDIHGSELGGGQLGIEGIVEGDDGDVIGDPQSLLEAYPLQRQRQHIVADHEGRGNPVNRSTTPSGGPRIPGIATSLRSSQ